MTHRIPAILSAVFATVAVGGALAVAARTAAGTAPANGEMTFDAPGCLANEYDGPGRLARYQADRGCPLPTAVVVDHTAGRPGAWTVTWDGSRSYDRTGDRLVRYRWSLGTGTGGASRSGPRLTLAYRHSGRYEVVLAVTDASGSTGFATAAVTLP